MRAQFLGIYISLMVHGMAAIILYGVSQGMTPTAKTVVLDFSLDAGGPMGGEGPAEGGGSGGGAMQPQGEASSPKDSSGGRKIESPMNSGNTRLSGVPEPPPLVPEKRPPVLERTIPTAETVPPVDEEPVAVVETPPVLTAPSPVRAETPPTDKRLSPARRVLQDDTPQALRKSPSPKLVQPKPVPRKNTVEPVPEKMAKPDPPIPAAQKTLPPTQVNSLPEKKPKPLPPMQKSGAVPRIPGSIPWRRAYCCRESIRRNQGVQRKGPVRRIFRTCGFRFTGRSD